MVKGSVVYTSSFTPSAIPLTAITNTSLLTAQNTTIVDNSTNAFTVTNNNSVSYSLNTPFPSAIATGALFATQVNAGGTHSVAIDSSNKLYGWGLNTSGQLGLVNTATTQIDLSNNWNSVVAGSEHTIALDNIGTLYTWGLSTLGQLGLNDIVTRSSPTQVTSMSLANLSSPTQVGSSSYNFVCAGNNTTAAISSDNKLFVWD
jgi:alpha-tubulin suppressor-like RCC1 family protein